MPATSPQLQEFIDDELARAPLLIDEVLQQLGDAPLRLDASASAGHRRAATERQAAVMRQRGPLVQAFTDSLREQVGQATRSGGRNGGSASGAQVLSLVDESEVATDVELQRATVLITSTAEYELRELGTFTSALVGDLNVARDTNPLRPEAYARALLAGVRTLAMPADEQLAVMRLAIAPLSQALRKAYAAACTRLESQGVEPGTFRTIILPGGLQSPRMAAAAAAAEEEPADLHALRDSMPMPLDDLPEPGAASAPALTLPTISLNLPPTPAPPAAHAPVIDHQLIELLTRLFDAILADRALAPDLRTLLSRLQTSSVRVALRDPAMLDSYDHPVWQFIDRIAFIVERHDSDAASREKLLRHAQGLIENMVGEASQDAALYRWGLQRLAAYEQHLLQQHCADAQPQIDSLRTLAFSMTGPAPTDGPPDEEALDVGSLETVPAELMDLAEAPSTTALAAPSLPLGQAGDWLHLYLQGGWRDLQLLWTDSRGGLWLYRQPGGQTWALHRAALASLREAGLAQSMSPPSLVQQAALTVLRQVSPAAPRA